MNACSLVSIRVQQSYKNYALQYLSLHMLQRWKYILNNR